MSHKINIQFEESKETDVEESQNEITSNDETESMVEDEAESDFEDEEEQEEQEEEEEEEEPKVQKPKPKVTKQKVQHGFNFEAPTRILTLGPCFSGKTTAIRHMIKYFKSTGEIAGIWWFGSSAHDETWLPKQYRYEKVSKTKIEAIRNMQKKPQFKNYYQIIVLDDILDTNFHSDKWWAHFISTCRHQNIILLIGLQYLKAMPPVFRDNVQSYVVCSANNGTTDALYNLSRNPSKHDFRQHFSELVKGKPIIFSTVPGSKEITQIELGPLEPKNMK